MSVQVLNPEGLVQPEGYFQVAVGKGSSIVCLSGQVAVDAQGQLVGRGDLAAQAEQVYRNLHCGLAAAGASFADVVKLTIYVPGYTPDKMEAFVAGMLKAAQDLGFDPRRPATLVGVSALVSPDYLLEIEALAVLPG